MAIISGQVLTSGAGGEFSTMLSSAMHGFALDIWPPHDAITGEIVEDAADTHFPVAAAPRAIAGMIATTFSVDWYHRIHLRPRVLALGNLVSTQVETIEVWNAFLHAVTLAAIDGVEEGIALDGPATFPLVFQALELVTWDVSITQDGPSSIEVTLTWDFDTVHDVSLVITGSRVVAFAFAPNWATPILERFSFRTNVLGSPSGAEQRRARRLSPRRQFNGELVVEGRERAFFDNVVAGWGGQIWAMPVWPDAQVLQAGVSAGAVTIACSTTDRDFRVGGLVMLRGSSALQAEAGEIEAMDANSITLRRPLQASWAAGVRLYPARTAMFREQPAARRHTDTTWTASLVFELREPSDWPALTGLPTYRGHLVYEIRPDESDNPGITTERLLEMLDNDSGIPRTLDTAEQPFPVRAYHAVLNGVAERADFRALLYTLNGRQVALWFPSHADDLRILTTVSAVTTAITVENVGYARFGFDQVGRRDIRIELYDGTTFHRQITDASEIDADEEQIVIDSALGQIVDPADVRRTCFMALMRSNSDEFEIRHETDAEGVATADLELRAIRDDLVDP